MRLFFQLFFLLLLCEKLPGQIKGDYVWELGPSSNAGQGYGRESIVIDFNNDTLTMDTIFRPLFMGYLNASISDDDGKLLLYTNGCEVKNGNHQLIQGSRYLNSGDVNTEWCVQNHLGYSIFEGGIFLPFNKDSIINLIHQRLIILGQPIRIFVDTLFYSQFKKSGDSYEMIEKRVPIVGGKLFVGNVEAVKTLDGKGWWIIQNVQSTNEYYTMRFLNGKIDTLFSQFIGDSTSTKNTSQSVYSPDGKMFARYSSKDQLFLFNFNQSSGLLSNYQKIFVTDTSDYTGLAFSSSGEFLYACTTKDLFQFNIWNTDIEPTKIHIGHYDGYADPFPCKFYLMQLGPDCRIYINTTNGNKAWHVIQEPNEEGLACRFEQHAFQFPVSNSITMPNFPVFRVNEDQPCNPDIKTGFFEYYVPPLSLDIFPNPTEEELHINLPEVFKNERNIQIQILDHLGRAWKEKKIEVYEGSQVMECEDLPAGLYFIQVKSERKWIGGEFVKM